MPAGIAIGVDLLVLAALLVLIGLSKGLQYSLIGLLKWLASAVRHLPLVGGSLAGRIDDAARWLYNQLGVGILALERSVVFFWHNLAELAIFLGEQIKGLAYDVLWLYHHVGKYLLPAWEQILLRWIGHNVAALLRHPLGYLRRALAEIEHAAHVLARAVAHAPGLVIEVPAWVGKRLGALEREATAASGGRFKWLERLALGTLGAGIALKLLERVAPWLRCRNINKAGRALCGANSNLLDSLLNDLLILAGPISFVAFVRECADVAPELEDGLRFFIREAHRVGA